MHRVTTQATIKNLQGRSIRLDILAEDEAGGKANVEIQRDSRGAGAKRARYNGSILDANSILPGEDCEDLPENFVVFITEKDVFHKGLPIYIFERYCITPDGPMAFDDKLHIIYVNGQIQDETPLGLLMHDFHCTNPDDMHYNEAKDVPHLRRWGVTSRTGGEHISRLVETPIGRFRLRRNLNNCVIKFWQIE